MNLFRSYRLRKYNTSSLFHIQGFINPFKAI